MQEKIYKLLPVFFQNVLITIYDFMQYNKRHGGSYKKYLNEIREKKKLSLNELLSEQKKMLIDFLKYAKNKSKFYNDLLSNIDIEDINQYSLIPILSKEIIRSNINDIYTISKIKSVIAKTGGTTGKSLQVRFTNYDIQKRHATLDMFRSEWGYSLGKKVAWFSGKSLLTKSDIHKKRFWKYDYLYKIRYYSTFHINAASARHYINDLNKFQPKFAVGFPSSMVEIAKWGISHNYPLHYKMTTIFPTAETIVPNEREVLEKYFGGNVANQYASSEGAPFIIECKNHKLHMDLFSGWFEVLNDNNEESKTGRLVFTSFTTHGTPLIRYNINDIIEISEEECNCGNNNPVVAHIEGRINDFIYSEETGKINLGNISNCVKYVNGVVKFQVIQDQKDKIEVLIVKAARYENKDEKMFEKELRDRLGNKMEINFTYVNDIPVSSSGKYQIVVQKIKF